MKIPWGEDHSPHGFFFITIKRQPFGTLCFEQKRIDDGSKELGLKE
jgi:hypothetical protein